MNIDLLTVPGCPNRAETLARLHQALAATGTSDVVVNERVVDDAADAAAAGLHGSPTILIDGRDPFSTETLEPSVSCRLYRTTAGVEGAPSVAALIGALR